MFQNYIHPAATDPELPFLDVEGTNPTLFTYVDSRETAGLSFHCAAVDGYFNVYGLENAPKNALLVVSLAATAQPAGLSSVIVDFYNGLGGRIGVSVVQGNGLGTHADAVPIPNDAHFAHVYPYGFVGLGGQVRVVAREAIPYQPLKG